MKDWWSKVEDIAVDKLNWWTSGSKDNDDWCFSKGSPEGQDCNIDLNAATYDELVKQLQNWCECFDVSYETYLWLDEWGHGINGAPYDMRDLYNDMEWFLNEAYKLLDALKEAQ